MCEGRKKLLQNICDIAFSSNFLYFLNEFIPKNKSGSSMCRIWKVTLKYNFYFFFLKEVFFGGGVGEYWTQWIKSLNQSKAESRLLIHLVQYCQLQMIAALQGFRQDSYVILSGKP